MSAKTLNLSRLTRFTKDNTSESLEFQPGLNLIEGPKDSGKTKWLLMLDYLFGDPSPPENALGAELAERYIRIRGDFMLAGEPLVLERDWHTGFRTKVLVDGEQVSVDSFSDIFLYKLHIPIIRFPKGSPYNSAAWPRLSWRMLVRHIFRGEHYWNDLVPKQPESEQHACVLQILGAAKDVYSDAYETLVAEQKEAWKLEVTRDEIDRVLNEVTLEIVGNAKLSVALTPESLQSAIHLLHVKLASKEEERERFLRPPPQEPEDSPFKTLRLRWAEAEQLTQDLRHERTTVTAKLLEYQEYARSVKTELERFDRAQIAGALLADLKVTHCPVCDQEVSRDRFSPPTCYLCGQESPDSAEPTAVTERIDFERAQLHEESAETETLIEKAKQELDVVIVRLNRAEAEFRELNDAITPARRAALSTIGPDLLLLERELGQIAEQIRQLERLKAVLDRKNSATAHIDQLYSRISSLQAELQQMEGSVPFAQLSDEFSAALNTYLNTLNEEDHTRWTPGPLIARITADKFSLTINNRPWATQLGGTNIALALFAYHYALLSLTAHPDKNYPGLAILDFPPKLSDDLGVQNDENYLLKPFIELLSRTPFKDAQMIVAGRAFEGLPAASRTRLPARSN